MDSYSESYQNGGSRREADLQGLAQNIGTNIQKILQNGEIFRKYESFVKRCDVTFFFLPFDSFVYAAYDCANWDSTRQPTASKPTVSETFLREINVWHIFTYFHEKFPDIKFNITPENWPKTPPHIFKI